MGARPAFPDHADSSPNDAPDRQGTLVDITCDSDGKISKFIDLQDVQDTLPLHKIIPGEPYYLGIFLIGAYQDIMGDLHNLFGRVNEVHVFLDDDEESGWYIEEVIEGSTIGQVLALTQWDKIELMRLMKLQVDAAIKSDRLKPNDAMKILADYERGLQGYTYLALDGAATPEWHRCTRGVIIRSGRVAPSTDRGDSGAVRLLQVVNFDQRDTSAATFPAHDRGIAARFD